MQPRNQIKVYRVPVAPGPWDDCKKWNAELSGSGWSTRYQYGNYQLLKDGAITAYGQKWAIERSIRMILRGAA